MRWMALGFACSRRAREVLTRGICLAAAALRVGPMLCPSVQGETAQAAGSIRGWGAQTVGVDLDAGFVGVTAGMWHSLGLKADGTVIAWGGGRCKPPAGYDQNLAIVAGAKSAARDWELYE